MYFHSLAELARVNVRVAGVGLLLLTGWGSDAISSAAAAAPAKKQIAQPTVAPASTAPAPSVPTYVVVTALTPGVGHTVFTIDPRAAKYYDNVEAVQTGKALFSAMNCSGCHTNGGGGMAPSLLDSQWIYGGRLEQIHHSIAEGRPNGMPSWAALLPDEMIWRLAAYVRSMSLPATLAAQGNGNPSQSPAPVPRAVDEDPGWSAPASTTNDYSTTLKGR
jgi:cytochrome c oxidase cbb3-type subunit 3